MANKSGTLAPDCAPVHIATGSTQVTYIPDRHCFAVWRCDGTESSPALGDAVGIDIVRPDEEGRLAVTTVRARVVDASDTGELQNAVDAAGGGSLSASADAWIAIARHHDLHGPQVPLSSELIEAVPVAGRAVPDATGGRVPTAAAAVEAFTASATVKCALDKAGATFIARPYQVRGMAWMAGLPSGGGILSDEMGLGKTLQAVSHMSALARDGHGPFLVICPTSLVSNWRREVERFSDGALVCVLYRGPNRTIPSDLDANTVVIAGYATLRTDAELLAGYDWDVVFYDEAHMLKNSRTKLARAARAVRARSRIALTGTPVENHMEELWALLDLTNPNLLGSRARFNRRFSQPIEQHGSATALDVLTRAIEPVVLRRTKATVATDLPPKNQINVVCSPTPEQVRLYNAALDTAFDSGFGAGGSRGTRILALLTELKLICNHPELVEPSSTEWGGRSGKLDRTTEIVTELSGSGSKTLVFTQYRKTGEMLSEHLAAATGKSVSFFHGGLTPDRRDEMVQNFRESDSSSTLVLSLRAAGYGLNLTEASTVIHFDRWWNPAVEAQATDRAHRIGQTSPVTVFTLTTEGTLEEYIAELHDRKKAISALTESNASAALAALDDMDLRTTLSLREVRN